MKDLKETTYDRFGLFHMSVVSNSFGFLEAFKVSTKNNKNGNQNENKNNIIDMNTMKGNTI